MKESKTRTLRGLTKGNVWDLQETDIFMMWAKPDKDDAVAEHAQHYLDVISAAFYLEEIKVDKPEILKKYEDRGMRIGIIPIKDKDQKWAIKKRPINHQEETYSACYRPYIREYTPHFRCETAGSNRP